jgi:regulator of ribosome biosynthesis
MSKSKQSSNFNKAFDLGHLLVNDSQPFETPTIHEEDINERAIGNLKSIYGELFKLCDSQKGKEDKTRDFDKAVDNVTLPKPTTILPRAKPVPKAKPLTRWERYRVEKGMAPAKKKSRMVFSELAQDWVPRWGKGR